MERGKSGRLSRLKIVGTKRTLILGKELEIRRALSESHLYSSAFVVDVAERDTLKAIFVANRTFYVAVELARDLNEKGG